MSYKNDINVLSGRLHRIIGKLCELEDDIGILYNLMSVSELSSCRMTPSDYYPCAEDDCMRLSMRMWTCSECEADYVGSKPNFCPFCGAKVVSE